jgi:hypothetical protein
LDEFLSPFSRAERICTQGVGDFQGRPVRRALTDDKIHRLSDAYGRTIYAVEIEGDLRSLFYLDGENVVSLIIGTHDIYKG